MYKYNQENIRRHLLSNTYEKLLILGLLKKNIRKKIYLKEQYGKENIKVESCEVKNQYSRIDILYFNDKPIGWIIIVKLINGIYHMVEMYVDPEFRSKRFIENYPHVNLKSRYKTVKISSPANYLLCAFLEDVVARNALTITLEVKNNNEIAWHLYEKKLLHINYAPVGFKLMNKNEIISYANIRKKKICKWYQIKENRENDKFAIQWCHIPDYGGNPERWSANRLYYINNNAEELNLVANVQSRLEYLINKLKNIMINSEIIKYCYVFIENRYSCK